MNRAYVEFIAREIAFWHGQKPLYREPGGAMMTVASARGGRTGWADELDRYVDRHWQEYEPAASVIMARIERRMEKPMLKTLWALICPPRIFALIWPPIPTHMRKTIVYDQQELAQRTSERFDGALSADEVLAVWERHPEFAPGGRYWEDSDLTPRQS